MSSQFVLFLPSIYVLSGSSDAIQSLWQNNVIALGKQMTNAFASSCGQFVVCYCSTNIRHLGMRVSNES